MGAPPQWLGHVKMRANNIPAIERAIRECNPGPLPFWSFDPDDPDRVLSAWIVSERVDDETDFAVGVVYATELLKRAKLFDRQSGMNALRTTLDAMVRSGELGRFKNGFLARIAQAAILSSLN